MNEIRPEWRELVVAAWSECRQRQDKAVVTASSADELASLVPPPETIAERLLLRGAIADLSDAAKLAMSLGYSIENVRVRSALEFIAANVARADLNETTVAGHVGLSRSHFARLFNRTTGTSFRECVNDLRVRMSLEDLRSEAPVRSIKEIAYRCGYRSSGEYCRQFRRIFGKTPGEARRQAA